MKPSDIAALHESGLISGEQHARIIEYLRLRKGESKFLAILAWIGAVLVIGGVILLISANWEEIPDNVKIAIGLSLMLGAHAGGYWLRDIDRKHRKTGEALHLVGSGLFLGNIALVGQIYNLSSRTPDAILLWWLGIAAFPWLLRSTAQHILGVLAFAAWFSLEVNERTSWVFLGNHEMQIVFYSLLSLGLLGAGYCLRHGQFSDFAGATEKLGLAGLHFFLFPLTWLNNGFWHQGQTLPQSSGWLFGMMAVLAATLLSVGLARERLSEQWRWTWGLALTGTIALMAVAGYVPWMNWQGAALLYHGSALNALASIVIFIFCLLQIQVGLQLQSPFAVNLAIVSIAFNILTTYVLLIGSMTTTGWMFVLSGCFLIAFGVYLEKKRRALLSQMEWATQ